MKLRNPAPYGWQSRGWIAGSHRGIDYGWYNADPAKSRQVFAAAPGIVFEVYNGGQYNQGWGSRAAIRHTDRAFTTYNHHPVNGIALKVGQQVDYGTFVGTMGSTGEITGISLHFELYIDGNRVDPAPYFTKELPGTPVIAVAPPVLGVKDRLTVAIGVNARTEPTSLSAKVKGVPGNTAIAMQGFRDDGQDVQGNRRWFLSAEGHWYWSGGFTSTAKTGLTDLTPVIVPPSATVTFENGEGAVIGTTKVEIGQPIAPTAFPQNMERPGFTFEGWLNGGSPWSADTVVPADTRLVASWSAIPVVHTVTFNDGSMALWDVPVKEGDLVAEPSAPTRPGFTFLGWRRGSGDPYDFSQPVTEGFTLNAWWEAAPEPEVPDTDTPPNWFVNFIMALGAFLAGLFKPKS